jgi:hypothetical protein
MRTQALAGVAVSGQTTSGDVDSRALTITIGGVDRRCAFIDPVGFTITRSLSGGLSECAAAFREPVPQEGQEIVFNLGGAPFWGGTILTDEVVLVGDVYAYWQVQAVDWTWLLNRYKRVTATYDQLGVNSIVARVLNEFTDPASGFHPGQVDQALGTLERITFTDDLVSEAISRIAQAARRSEGCFWRIRPNRAIDVGVNFPEPPLTITDSSCLEYLRYDRTLAQVRTESRVIAGGSTTTAFVAASASTIPVGDGRRFNRDGGMVRVGDMNVTYTGVETHTLIGCSGNVRDIGNNTAVNPIAIVSDPAAQTALATVLGHGQSGIATYARENLLLSFTEAEGAALSDVELHKAALPTLRFGLTTAAGRALEVGTVVDVNLTRPIPVTGTFRVQELTRSSMTAALLEGPQPRLRYEVEARLVRRPTWFEYVTLRED